jgi:large subunit ribosomal protein L25
MDNIVLKATRRSMVGKQVKVLRRQGQLPAVMYGHNFEPIAIALDAHQASLQLTGISASTIVTIDLEGEQHAAIVRDRQKDYLKNRLTHLDFQVVSQNEKIRASVSLEVTGVAPAIKDFNAVVVSNLNQLEVEAYPRDLPERIMVDVSGIANIGDAIYVRDLPISDDVTILISEDEVVVVATGAAPEIEEEVVVEEVSEPEVIERGKQDEDEEEAEE